MTKEQYAKMLRDGRWRETRERVNNYAKGRCEACGERTLSPQVHHVEYHGYHPSDTPDDFLLSLCPECHYEGHWTERIRAYSAEKKRLYKLGVWIDDDMQQQLAKKFRV